MTVNIDTESANIPLVMFTEQGSDPAAPSAGYAAGYVKNGIFYVRNSSGIWVAMANPMTTQDDLVVGGASGVPGRLAKGSDGYVLTVDPTTHHLVWATAAGMANPMTTQDDLIVGGASGAPGRLAKGSDSQVLTVDPATHHLAWATPAASTTPGLVQLAQSILSAPAASIDLASLSQAYTSLYITYVARTSDATNNQSLDLRVNNDTGNNYYWQDQWNNVAGVTGSNAGPVAQARVGLVTPSGATAAYCTVGYIRIIAYAQTTFDKLISAEWLNLGNYDGTLFAKGQGWARWLSTAAINRLTLFSAAGNLVAGSMMTVYGEL